MLHIIRPSQLLTISTAGVVHYLVKKSSAFQRLEAHRATTTNMEAAAQVLYADAIKNTQLGQRGDVLTLKHAVNLPFHRPARQSICISSGEVGRRLIEGRCREAVANFLV